MLLAIGIALIVGSSARAEGPNLKSFAQATAGLERRSGLLPVFLDAKGGRVLLALNPDAAGDCGTFLYQTSMRSGLGSTPVGIDRSNPGSTRVVTFRRVGPKVFVALETYEFRADGGSADEKQAVRESFPSSIIWSADILAEELGGAVLVDISSFLTRDAFGVIDALKGAEQGDFKLVPERRYPDVSEVQTFPENLEFEAHETFESANPGREVRDLAPEPTPSLSFSINP